MSNFEWIDYLQWHFEKKYLLTGTPVQNNLKELYALLSFISPGKFDPDKCDSFVEKFSDVEESGMIWLNGLLLTDWYNW